MSQSIKYTTFLAFVGAAAAGCSDGAYWGHAWADDAGNGCEAYGADGLACADTEATASGASSNEACCACDGGDTAEDVEMWAEADNYARRGLSGEGEGGESGGEDGGDDDDSGDSGDSGEGEGEGEDGGDDDDDGDDDGDDGEGEGEGEDGDDDDDDGDDDGGDGEGEGEDGEDDGEDDDGDDDGEDDDDDDGEDGEGGETYAETSYQGKLLYFFEEDNQVLCGEDGTCEEEGAECGSVVVTLTDDDDNAIIETVISNRCVETADCASEVVELDNGYWDVTCNSDEEGNAARLVAATAAAVAAAFITI